MTLIRSKALPWLSAAAVSALLLSGCSSSDDKKDSTDGGSDGPATAAEVTPDPNTVDVVRTTELKPEIVESGETKSNNDDRVVAGFAGLKVSGKLSTLTMTFTPEFSSVGDDETLSLFKMFDEHSYEPSLVDMENLKRYSVATGDGGTTFGPNVVNTEATNHEPVAVSYTFAAPALDVIDVYFADSVLFDNVKVQR